MKLTDEQRRLQNLLTSALEGGSNYWYQNADVLMPEGVSYDDFRKGGKFTDPDDYRHPLEIVPFVPGCSLTLEHDADGDWKTVKIDESNLRNALKLMHEKYPQHYANVLNEDDDASTGDVLLQLAIFGEVVFG